MCAHTCGSHSRMCVHTCGAAVGTDLHCPGLLVLEDSAEGSRKPALRAPQTGPGFLLSHTTPLLGCLPCGHFQARIPWPIWTELTVAVLGLRTEHRVLPSSGQKAEWWRGHGLEGEWQQSHLVAGPIFTLCECACTEEAGRGQETPSLWDPMWTHEGRVRARASRVTSWGQGKGWLKGPGKEMVGRQRSGPLQWGAP